MDGTDTAHARATTEPVRLMRRAAIAAFAWGVLFGLVSFYWAAGGTIGMRTLSRSIQEMAERREPSFVATVWLTGVAKIVGGTIPLALAFGAWRRVTRRLLSLLCWAGGALLGALLVLYGLGDMIRAALVLGSVIAVDTEADRNIVRWYLFLWGPVWVIGGVCFLLTAWYHRRVHLTG